MSILPPEPAEVNGRGRGFSINYPGLTEPRLADTGSAAGMCLTLARQEPTRARGALHSRPPRSMTGAGAVTRAAAVTHGTAAHSTGSTEQPFEVDELFFSATDRKGIITSGNSVFVRVSGYGRDELVGRAHNLVRHPDMPRAVFQVLWDYLEAGRPIAAYVKNLAKNGNHYWVVATVAPTEDGGYLSVRIKPTAGIRDVVEPLYAQVRAHERALEAAGTPRKEVVAAGLELLVELIGKAGFASYDDLMRHFLPAELARRDAALGHTVTGGDSRVSPATASRSSGRSTGCSRSSTATPSSSAASTARRPSSLRWPSVPASRP